MLSLTNVNLTDRTALLLAAAIERNHTLRVLNVETNFISPPVIVTLVKSLLTQMTIEEFRASNQVWNLNMSCSLRIVKSYNLKLFSDHKCWATRSRWRSRTWWRRTPPCCG